MAQGRVIQLSRKPLFARLDELPGLSGMRQDFIKVRVSSLPWQQSLIAWSSSSFPWFLRVTRSPRPYQVAIPRSKRRGSISTLRLPQGRVMSLGVVSGASLKYKQLQNGTGARSRSGTGCLDLSSCVGRTNSPGVYPFSFVQYFAGHHALVMKFFAFHFLATAGLVAASQYSHGRIVRARGEWGQVIRFWKKQF